VALLDANPFITGLLIKHFRGSAAETLSAENEELVALRAVNNSIRRDYQWLRADFETVKQQKEAAETVSASLEIQFASAVEERGKDFKEIEILKESLSKIEAELSDVQARLAGDNVQFLSTQVETPSSNKTFSSKQMKTYRASTWNSQKQRWPLPMMLIRLLQR
jgi:chromosome segregation ATPase